MSDAITDAYLFGDDDGDDDSIVWTDDDDPAKPPLANPVEPPPIANAATAEKIGSSFQMLNKSFSADPTMRLSGVHDVKSRKDAADTCRTFNTHWSASGTGGFGCPAFTSYLLVRAPVDDEDSDDSVEERLKEIAQRHKAVIVKHGLIRDSPVTHLSSDSIAAYLRDNPELRHVVVRIIRHEENMAFAAARRAFVKLMKNDPTLILAERTVRAISDHLRGTQLVVKLRRPRDGSRGAPSR